MLMRKWSFFQSGSSLIEVMVALLVLAIGLLGVVSLQTKALRGSQQSVFVTESQFLAQDMADRIMAYERIVQRAGVVNPYGDVDADADAVNNPCDGTGCDLDDLKDRDVFQWNTMIEDSSLPSAFGEVDDRGNGLYFIRITWDQNRDGSTDDDDNTNLVTGTFYEIRLQL